MLNFDPTSSSQTAERQRRQSADEKSRVDRLADAATLRQSQARAVAEAPSEADVERFRALMSNADKSAAQSGKNRPSLDTPVRADSAEGLGDAETWSSASGTTISLADRYRAMLLASDASSHHADGNRVDDDAANSAATTGGRQAPGPGSSKDVGKVVNGKDDGAMHSPTSEVGDTADKPATNALESPGQAAEAGKSDDAPATGGKPRATDKGDAKKDGDASAALDRKAATGDTQALVIARRKSDSSDAGAAGAGQQDAPQSMPAMPQTAFNPMASSPQSPQTANASSPSIPQAGMIAPQLVDLIRNNVKQMLISDGRSSRLRSREVLLRMQDDTLPGTDLWLMQTDGGWHLRADISSREGYDTLMANKDELIQRFADQALGELSIEPIYHD